MGKSRGKSCSVSQSQPPTPPPPEGVFCTSYGDEPKCDGNYIFSGFFNEKKYFVREEGGYYILYSVVIESYIIGNQLNDTPETIWIKEETPDDYLGDYNPLEGDAYNSHTVTPL